MDLLVIALILGIIEGLTEFLPISSTGHLIIASDLLNLDQAKYSSFNIIIQLGAILAVVFLYFQRIKDIYHPNSILNLKNNLKKERLNLLHIALAIFPTLCLGYLSRHYIKNYLFNPYTVISSLIFVGILMIIIEKTKPKSIKTELDHVSYGDAFIIGLGQCFSLIPGVSRSGATMLTAMLRKIDVKTAADFSFLISVPVITIATVYEFLKTYKLFNASDSLQLFIGFAVSFLVAIAAIKLFLSILKKLSLTPFAIYRILVGLFYYLYLSSSS